MRVSAVLWCWLGLGWGLLASCSDRDMNLDDEGAGDAPGDEPFRQWRWNCAGEVVPPAELGLGEMNNAFATTVRDAVTRREVTSGIVASVCQILDGDCAVPSAVAQFQVLNPNSAALPPADATVALVSSVPPNFEGFLQLEAEPAGYGPVPYYVPTDYYFGGPIVGTALHLAPILLQPAQTWWGLLQQDLAVSPNTGMGAVTVSALDCFYEASAGVRVTLNETAVSVPWVFRNGLMTPNRGGELATDATGSAGFVNVPPGIVTIEGRVQVGCAPDSDCSDVPWEVVASVSTRIRPGRITLIELRHDYSHGR